MKRLHAAEGHIAFTSQGALLMEVPVAPIIGVVRRNRRWFDNTTSMPHCDGKHWPEHILFAPMNGVLELHV